MRILIFHNLLWSQYKSVIFEQLSKICLESDLNSDLLVIQTAVIENSRKDLLSFKVENFPFNYNFKLISELPLEFVNPLKIFFIRLKYILKFKPTVINFTGYNELSTLPLLLLCKCLKIKTIITSESVKNYTGNKNFNYYVKFIFKIILFKLADGFFSFGLKSNTYLFQHFVGKNKIFTFLNTFDKKKFKSNNIVEKSNEYYLLFIGRLSKEKNLITLVELFKNIKKKIPYHKLLIIGSGPEKQNLQLFINENKLDKDIVLLGSIMWNDLVNYYKNANCLLLPSLYEPWGMVANEALELNTPVIATSNCGCSDDLIINNYNGLIVQDITSEKNITSIIEFIKTNSIKLDEKFIINNSKIFNLERLCWEMMNGFKIITKN